MEMLTNAAGDFVAAFNPCHDEMPPHVACAIPSYFQKIWPLPAVDDYLLNRVFESFVASAPVGNSQKIRCLPNPRKLVGQPAGFTLIFEVQVGMANYGVEHFIVIVRLSQLR